MIEDTPFIQIVYEEIEEYGLYDHKIKLYDPLRDEMVPVVKPERRLTKALHHPTMSV